MIGLAAPLVDLQAHAYFRPAVAIYGQTPVAEGGSLPCFGGSGTGGIEDGDFVMSRQGYSPFTILWDDFATTSSTYTPYTDLMKEVKAGFGRTMSHLPAVFGVSRQTLYNWLNGETPKQQHQGKLVQLAAAAHAFTEAGFMPSAQSLDRTVAQGKSFMELIGQGADGKTTAEQLIRIERRGATARSKLDALLGDRTPLRLDEADMGRPALNEED